MPREQRREGREDWHRYALALEASQEGFWDWDLAADRLWCSRQWRSITGVQDDCSRLSTWMERVHPHDKPRFEAELRAARAGKARTIRNEHRIRHESGTWRWVLARAVVQEDARGRVTHLAGSLMDNTENRLADALTGLPNRLFFMDHMERRLERARQREDWDFAVLAVAMDRFDRVNETLGSSAGDCLLIRAAERLQAVVPEGSVTARLNGAEFLVYVDAVSGEGAAVQFARELMAAFREPLACGGHRIGVQLAIGLAQGDAACCHPEDLMSAAENALTHARREERPGIVCYAQGMREKALARLEMEADLGRAIRAGELTLFYQPEVDLRTGGIIGFEALVRWRHPERGLLPPAEFIPLAEETGLILPLGGWGLREACRQLVAWQKTGIAELKGTRVSVNLSARQFERADLVEQVRRVLEETCLDPDRLRLEITESCLISDVASALATMQGLRRLGVGLHMDDFGVGYSSLNYLQQYPFDTLKIDRSFVQGMVRDRDSRQIVKTILELARSFGKDVVAEGIEDAEQLEELKQMGCPCGQGYYFARPMEPAMIDALVRSGAWRTGQSMSALG